MKHVVGVSLGSSKRNSKSEANILGEDFVIERIGTDGDKTKFSQLITTLDGKVDAFGLGGTDRYLCTDKKKYVLKEADRLARLAKVTPIADGSGVKNTLERRTIEYVQSEGVIDFTKSKALLVCGVDRFGMAQSLSGLAKEVIYGDLMFDIGLPIPIRSYKILSVVAAVCLPIVCNLPSSMIYPTGDAQDASRPKYEKYYNRADAICGDFLLIRRTLPNDLRGKIIITNTVTAADKDLLAERGLKALVTTSPEYNGRRYGTNVLEAIMLTFLGKKADETEAKDYIELIEKMQWKPTVTYLND